MDCNTMLIEVKAKILRLPHQEEFAKQIGTMSMSCLNMHQQFVDAEANEEGDHTGIVHEVKKLGESVKDYMKTADNMLEIKRRKFPSEPAEPAAPA